MTSFAIESVNAANADQGLILAISELLCNVWPKPGRTPASRAQGILAEFAEYHGPAAQSPRGFLIREHGEIVAYAAVKPRTIRVGDQEATIAGLASVCTHDRVRGKGYGVAVARAALATVDQGDFPWALFQTTPAVGPFYERLGAAIVTNRVINSLADDPNANPFWDGLVMRYPASRAISTGVIDLLGPGY